MFPVKLLKKAVLHCFSNFQFLVNMTDKYFCHPDILNLSYSEGER